jgi:hypothetical protein
LTTKGVAKPPQIPNQLPLVPQTSAPKKIGVKLEKGGNATHVRRAFWGFTFPASSS